MSVYTDLEITMTQMISSHRLDLLTVWREFENVVTLNVHQTYWDNKIRRLNSW